MSDEKFVIEYVDPDVFEQGVPARNLTSEEWAAIPEEIQKRLLKNGTYKKVKQEKVKEQ